MRYRFIPQIGIKPKIKAEGYLSIDMDGDNKRSRDALFFDDNDVLIAELKSPELIFVNQHGIAIKGYQPDGYTKTGVPKYKYIEWFCSFIKE